MEIFYTIDFLLLFHLFYYFFSKPKYFFRSFLATSGTVISCRYPMFLIASGLHLISCIVSSGILTYQRSSPPLNCKDESEIPGFLFSGAKNSVLKLPAHHDHRHKCCHQNPRPHIAPVVMQRFHLCSARAAPIAARLHCHGKITRPPECRDKEWHKDRDHRLGALYNPARFKIRPSRLLRYVSTCS